MSNVDPSLLILLVLAGLGIISHNMTVTLAMIFLLVIKITPLKPIFSISRKIRYDHWDLDPHRRCI